MTHSIIIGKITKIYKRGIPSKPYSVDITGFREVNQKREEDQVIVVPLDKLPETFQEAIKNGANKGTVGTYTFTVEIEDEVVISVTLSTIDMYDFPPHREPIAVPAVGNETDRADRRKEELTQLPPEDTRSLAEKMAEW